MALVLRNESTILIVANQDGAREVLAALLRPRYDIRTATTAQTALHIAQHEDVDLVIQDMGLPDRNGIDLLRDLMTLKGEPTKVIVITGSGTLQAAHDALELGAMAYLLKPFNLDEMLTLVQEALTPRVASSAGPSALR